MKTSMKFSILAAFFLLITAFAQGAPVARKITKQLPPVWELLGKRIVNYAVDHDEMVVTAAEGRFTAIKIKVKAAPLNMHRCVVHFGNGESFEAELRNNFQPGSESRVIDLPASERIINRISFFYDTKNHAQKRAVVEVWGRH